ncbi:hypothetical protein [Flavobacterium lacus]|uniref:Uncharacterized protein n=1 Tax=Flavobacterium lacus TaxID=1353778 RepID=A0A328WM95_9FLAO|nr:hypothetical protein [Flavobacterium lacus]RAR47420.1 hypothetical protein B0I10_10993 [Flavobacterium lacus]
MEDLTYTATGEIDVENRLIKLEIYLPIQREENPYEFNYNFNLSKITIFDKKYNVIFSHLKLRNDPGNLLNSQNNVHKMTLDVDKLIQSRFLGSTDFDLNMDDTLFLLLHDDSSKEVLKDAELLFANVENIYEKVISSGNQTIDLPYNNLTLRPRRLGMSIIIK